MMRGGVRILPPMRWISDLSFLLGNSVLLMMEKSKEVYQFGVMNVGTLPLVYEIILR